MNMILMLIGIDKQQKTAFIKKAVFHDEITLFLYLHFRLQRQFPLPYRCH
jgi:hypothetical protein